MATLTVLLLSIGLAPGVVASSRAPARVVAGPRVAARMSTSINPQYTRGVHGQGSRFMPLVGLKSKDYAPRLLPVAGMLPHVTYEQLMSPSNPVPPSAGRWKYYKLDGNAAPNGFVVVETPEILENAISPVVVVAMSADLGIPLTDGKNDEVLVIIERDDPVVTDQEEFVPGKFYAFVDPAGQIDIAWHKAYPADGSRICGRVLYTQLPWVAPIKKEATGWSEMSDEYEF
mmetsp:Transcript_28099/g.70719  ORF Transcript_28099/g.70719 Transcript_28099/m.70719 type:complete len:230 (+) Transcript_28099:67-756(+)